MRLLPSPWGKVSALPTDEASSLAYGNFCLVVFVCASSTASRELIKDGLCKNDGGVIYINAVTDSNDLHGEIVSLMKDTEQYKSIRQSAKKLDTDIYETIKKYANPYIEEDLGYYGFMNMDTRSILARLLYDKGCYQGHCGQFCEFIY